MHFKTKQTIQVMRGDAHAALKVHIRDQDQSRDVILSAPPVVAVTLVIDKSPLKLRGHFAGHQDHGFYFGVIDQS